MIGELPASVSVGGRNYRIRTNTKDILEILKAMNDPELEAEEKVLVCLIIFYKDYEQIPVKALEEAFEKAVDFIDCGMKHEDSCPVRTMDWEQDAAILFPAVNKVAGFETRTAKYLHWWTFVGYYMGISDGVFAQVQSLRAKKAKNKKLETWEQEFWNSNKNLCVLHEKLTKEEQEKKDRLNKMLI